MLLIGKNKFYQSKQIKGELRFDKYSSVQEQMKKEISPRRKIHGL